MIQQINLYQPMLRKQEKIFSAVAMLQISALVIVVFATIYGYHLARVEPVRNEMNNSTAQIEKMLKQLEAVTKKMPKQAKSRLLESEVAKLTSELEHITKVKQVLASGSFGNIDGFSSYFEALAKGHVQGTWLTGIHIVNGGATLSFNGKSIDPELVPVYLMQLSEEPTFQNRSFNILELNRSMQSQATISFNVGTGD